jgi:hypothetical protein
MFFEWMVEMRDGYARRGPLDRTSCVSIEEVIAHCELVMSQVPDPSPAERAAPSSEQADRH